MFRLILILSVASLLCYSCERMNNSSADRLVFSSDTVYFDTVFTSVGSVTKELRVKNSGHNSMLISHIYLAGGNNSHFRLNIDGEPVNEKSSVRIDAGDSLYIFIDANINPSDNSSPVEITDSIVFDFMGKSQSVNLLAWGQDIILLKNARVKTGTWEKGKPYVIYDRVMIDTSETLTIDEGARILFHRNALMKVAGTLIATGSTSSPVLFASDRLEKMYEDVPGQWIGIQFLGSSKGNKFVNSIIRNSVYGIQAGDVTQGAGSSDVLISSSVIAHSLVSGISAQNSHITVANSEIYHCGGNCIYISGTGEYKFIFCSIFNLWDYGFRQTPAFLVSGKTTASGQLNLNVANSLLFGDKSSELEIELSGPVQNGTYNFDNCLIRIDTLKAKFWKNERFRSVILNKNPLLIDAGNWDLRPDTLSPMINGANKAYMSVYPLDIRGFSRLKDGNPDIGAFERIPGEHKKEN